MKCTLMHKNVPVVNIELNKEKGTIDKIGQVFDLSHLPIGVSVRKNIIARNELNIWWTDRAIPSVRSGVRVALDYLGVKNPIMLLHRSYGLSLSDQYWIKPEGKDITWEDVNFFENPFSKDIGDVLFGTPKTLQGIDFSSPDNTSGGNLKKRWTILDGKRVLMKGGSNPFNQQPFNEVIATKIMERLGISHIPYSVIWYEDMPYSICENFVTVDTELVSAYYLMQIKKQDNRTSRYQHLMSCCEDIGVNILLDIDRMIVLDYIIANEDRHLNNFGLLRNAETLEWIGFAPIYDSGTSLGYSQVEGRILSDKEIECKPFKKNHLDQLKLVSDFSWIDFEKLKGVENDIIEIFSDEPTRQFISEQRVKAICDSVRKRIDVLQGIAMTHVKPVDVVDDDVEEDIAEDYAPKII